MFLLITAPLSAEGLYSSGSFGYDWIHKTFKTEMIVGYEFKGLYLEAEQETLMKKADLHMFSPFRQDYYARAGYKFKKVFINWEHLCIHGVDQYNRYDKGHDRFTIGFDTRLNNDN